MKLHWLIAAILSCSLAAVNGLLSRQSSVVGKETFRDVALPVATLAKLDSLRSRLNFKDAGYADVVDWLLANAHIEDAQHANVKDPPPHAVTLHQNGTNAAAKVAQAPAACLFDDQLFGMNPQMKAALQQELTAGQPLAEAAAYVKNHPNEGWMHCANSGQQCACTGNVRFGEFNWLGPSWSNPVHVAASTLCSPATFSYTLTNPQAAVVCQCAWDSEKLHQPSIQLRFNSWSYAQEAWIFLLRTMAQAKWLPWSGDRNFNGPKLFGSRGGGIFDRVWIHKWLDTVGHEYVTKYFGAKELNCLEWEPIFYMKKYPSCAKASYSLSYVAEDEKMGVHGKIIHADILKLPKVAGPLKMDLVVATQVWEHLSKPVESLTALYETLKPGGVLLFAVPFKAPFHGAPEDYWRYTKSGVIQVMEQSGFCVPRSAMASGGDFIYSIGLNAGISAGDFSQEELLNAYYRGYDNIPDGPLEIFAVGLKKKVPTDVCPP